MASPILGLILDSSVLVAAERASVPISELFKSIRQSSGAVPVALSPICIAELLHGVYRADSDARAKMRRQFVDDLKVYATIHPITEATAEIIARVGAEQAKKGISIPTADLIIGACALERDFAVATHNLRHFEMIPGLQVIKI